MWETQESEISTPLIFRQVLVDCCPYGLSVPPLPGDPCNAAALSVQWCKGNPVAREGSLVESEYRKGPGGALDRAVLRGVVNSF